MALGRLIAAIAGFWLVAAPAWARDDAGVLEDRIVFGQSAAFRGPAAALGVGMREGILAAFTEANRQGGVNGRRLELVDYDDGYEPDQAIANVRRLLDEHGVFALIGEVGTPTSKAVLPIARERGVPFLGPFTGAEFLRDPANTNVVNVRASYQEEAEAWVDYLTRVLGFARIAVLYQDDSYGLAGLEAVQIALAARDLELVAEGTFKRNTTAVKRALLTIKRAEPEAVVMFGTYEPIAAFIRLADQVGLDAVFVNSSFVGSTALSNALGALGEGVIVSQVVPLPTDTSVPLVARYQQALRAVAPDAAPGFVSLEGYIVGRLVIAALEQLGDPVTRAGLLDTIAAVGAFDIDGLKLDYGEDDNQGMHQVFLTVIDEAGDYRALGGPEG